jgi:glutamate synthase domain-containing protein 1
LTHRSVTGRDREGVVLVADRGGRASREIVERGLDVLRRTAERPSCQAAQPSAGSAGILTAIPWAVVEPELPSALRDREAQRIAAVFALEACHADRAIHAARSELGHAGWHVMAWREVPLRLDALPPDGRAAAPRLVQCFARASQHRPGRTAYRTRLAIEARWLRMGLAGCSVASLSPSTIVYKALAAPSALPMAFPDLADPRFVSSFAVLHFACGSGPSRWELAQPFHGIATEGSVATIAGNRLWMEARIADAGIRDEADLPKRGGSDAQTLDAAVQWLQHAGLSAPHAVARLRPPPWEHDAALPDEVRAFHRHESCFAERWEGPAALAFADGRHAGVTVDRNGASRLRIERDAMVVCISSDAAAGEGAERGIGSLASRGEMIAIDIVNGTMTEGQQVLASLASEKPYGAMAQGLIHRIAKSSRTDRVAFADGPALRTTLGRRGQWMPHALPPLLLELDSPVLVGRELEAILAQDAVRAAVLSTGFRPDEGCSVAASDPPADTLRAAVAKLQRTAGALAANGTRVLVLSDKGAEPGSPTIPSLTATSAVDDALRSAGLRLRTSIVVEAGDVRSAEDVLRLASRGCSAVVPRELYAAAAGLSIGAAERCRESLEERIRELMVEMGVSSFEALYGGRLEIPAVTPLPADPRASHIAPAETIGV